MKKEKLILSFVAIFIGILVTAGAYYLYQNTRDSSEDNARTIIIAEPSDAPSPDVLLSIGSPLDQSVVSKKVISVEGTTEKDATVVVITPVDQKALSPSSSGDFSTTVNIDDGQNFVEIIAVLPEGRETRIVRTVTFSTEDF